MKHKARYELIRYDDLLQVRKIDRVMRIQVAGRKYRQTGSLGAFAQRLPME